MKLTKNKVLVVAIAICLIATLSMGTLAWFFDTDTITNKFPIADSLTSFEIDVWEKVPDGDDADSNCDDCNLQLHSCSGTLAITGEKAGCAL